MHPLLKQKISKTINNQQIKLPVENLLINPTTTTTTKQTTTVGECLAVKDATGRRHCPHGMRLGATGRREYCRHPIDC